jgi:hypothetical protein
MAKVRILEVRTISLPIETAVDAILELDRARGGTLASAQLVEVRILPDPDPGLALVTMQALGGAATLEKQFSLAAIAAAAIHYCFRARIPVPRQATKSIEVTAEGFRLTIQSQTEVERAHGAVPKPSHAKGIHQAAGDAALYDPTTPVEGESATV